MENRKLKLISSILSTTLVTCSLMYTTYKFLFWVEEKYNDRKFPRELENKSNDTIEQEDKSNNIIEHSK